MDDPALGCGMAARPRSVGARPGVLSPEMMTRTGFRRGRMNAIFDFTGNEGVDGGVNERSAGAKEWS